MIKFIKKLFLPSSGEVAAPEPVGISRRKFFSFFGVGAVMLAKPDLFLPKVRPSSVIVRFSIEKEIRFERTEEALFFQMLCGLENRLLPNVPEAADGAALFSTTPYRIDWNENRELKRLAGW